MRDEEYQEDLYRLLFVMARESILWIREDGVILDANEAAVKMYGYELNEFRGMNMRNLQVDSQEVLIAQQLDFRNRERIRYEQVHYCKDGKSIAVEINSQGVVHNGEWINICFIRDTLRKVWEENNEEKLMWLASIVESTDAAIFSLNLDGEIVYWNKAAERIFGYLEDEVIGKSVHILAPPFLHREVEELLFQLKSGEKSTRYETIRTRKDGQFIYVSTAISQITDLRNKPIGFSVISRDVSDRKNWEREMARLDRLNVIGEMAAGISHEVRNPLTTVRGFLQRLSEKMECNSFNEYFEIMIGEIDRANSIISEFLTIGKTHAPGRKVHNLNTIVSVLYPLIEADAFGQDKRVFLELGNVPDFFVDDKEIRQIILNLARNGLEAMTAGGILTLKTYTKAEQVVLCVQDNGCGIPPYVMEKIGTPFFTTKEQGTGLGLAVCYGIASRHKASIHIDSSSSGTKMLVKFPSYIESV